MIAIDHAIARDFNAALAQAKLEALNILRALLTSAEPPEHAAHQRLAAAQILRTTFINLAQPRNRPAPPATDNTLKAQPVPPPQPADLPTITPEQADALIDNLPPERFLDIIESLPGGCLIAEDPNKQRELNLRLLQSLHEARPNAP